MDNSFVILVDVEHSHVRFLGNLVLNLWDCGGQESFMEQYFASQKDNIFRNVEVLIYVFDVESRELDNDMHYYQSCLEAIYKVDSLHIIVRSKLINFSTEFTRCQDLLFGAQNGFSC